MKTPIPILASLMDYQAWAAGEADFDMLDYAMCVGSPDVLVAFAELVDPELVVHDGEYFLAHNFDLATYDRWMHELGDQMKVQRVINHLHVASFMQHAEVPDEVAVFIAKTVAHLWSKTLRDKGLTAEYFGSTLEDAQVTFFKDS